MNPSLPYDPDHHEPGSLAATGRCSWHGDCDREAVVSFRDREDTWQSGCAVALQELVDRGDIEPLGQGA